MHACCPWRPEEGIGPLGLELQIVKSHCAGPGNQSQVLWNSEQSVLLPTESSLQYCPENSLFKVQILSQEVDFQIFLSHWWLSFS